ncbi:hypothetical protein LTS08_004369 [Lithohypha guttulata]|nr:hypothetical protein LTS08_004369 [Lithohypha guttulata]
MSSATSYLNSLLKIDLTDFAETSSLSNYAGLRKAELAEKLDDHLRRNATTYSKEPSLSEYYKRLGSTSTTRSPVKRIAEKVSDIVKSDDDDGATSSHAPATARKQRRRTRLPSEDGSTDAENPVSALIKTPGKEIARRASILAGQIPLPPSPAVVTDAIDQQTKRIRTSISHAYERAGFGDYSDYARELLSSTATINLLAILIEANGLRSQIMPSKPIAEIGPISGIKDTSTRVLVPDLFQLLNMSFWAPFSLWLLTTLILPALTSYFVNLPLRQLPSHSPARRASVKSNPHVQFDPFIFNLAKGLIVYLVYASHFQLVEVYKHATIATVHASVPGGYQGMLISSGLGAAVSLYEAVLKR